MKPTPCRVQREVEAERRRCGELLALAWTHGFSGSGAFLLLQLLGSHEAVREVFGSVDPLGQLRDRLGPTVATRAVVEGVLGGPEAEAAP